METFNYWLLQILFTNTKPFLYLPLCKDVQVFFPDYSHLEKEFLGFWICALKDFDGYCQIFLHILYQLVPLPAVYKNLFPGTSLVAQWLRIRLPMQGTRVPSLVREDPTCCGATKPTNHNYWAHVPQLLKPTHPRACVLQLLKPMCLEPMLCNKRSHRNEKAAYLNEE